MTDIMGKLMVVKVHAANIHDTMSGCHVYQAAKAKYPSMKGACSDEGYRRTFVEVVTVKYGDTIDISEKIKPKQWYILPKRWRVERTFGWVSWSRILSKDYETKVIYEENAFIVSHLLTLLIRY